MSEKTVDTGERQGDGPRWIRRFNGSPATNSYQFGTRLTAIVLMCLVIVPASTFAQDNPPLETKQEALSSRYSRFEKLLLQMAEYLGRTDPDRAELLMRALSRSREERISTRMNGIVELLRDEAFDDALEGQEQLVGQLRVLLELLQSEDRRSELEEETARIKKMLKDVNKLIGDQKIARATTARAGKPSDAMKSQQRVADNVKKVIDAAKAADDKKKQGKGEPKDGSKAGDENSDGDESDSGDKKSGDEKQPGEKEGEPGDPKASDPKDGEQGEPSESGKPSKGKPQDGKSQSGKPQDGQPQDGQQQDDQQQQQDDKSPGRDELEKARDAMNKAIEELKKDQKKGSTKEQDKALQNLLAAKEKLEEKLRQLREEERELMLAALEARFQKMLVLQLAINGATKALAGTEPAKWLERDFTRARELAQLENEVGIEASKALAVLKEEGTSVSFPLAVEDMREDVLTVARRLEDEKVGELTQDIQKDIVDALQEMADALQKEMEKSDDKKQQNQQQQGAPQNAQGDPVLVDMIAELKMLRTLQKRINRRTKQIGREIDGEQAEQSDLLEQLDKLADRQERIRQTAIDIEKTRGEK